MLQLSQQLCNYSSHSTEPRQTYGQTFGNQSNICAKYSRGPFTEEIIEIEIVPLKVEAENILKDSTSILFTVLENDLQTMSKDCITEETTTKKLPK